MRVIRPARSPHEEKAFTRRHSKELLSIATEGHPATRERPYDVLDTSGKIVPFSSFLYGKVPKYPCSRFGGEVGLREPSQNILHDLVLLLVHEPMTCTLVVDNLGLREEFLDQADAGLWTRTVSSSTEEENRDLGRVGQREVTGCHLKVSEAAL